MSRQSFGLSVRLHCPSMHAYSGNITRLRIDLAGFLNNLSPVCVGFLPSRIGELFNCIRLKWGNVSWLLCYVVNERRMNRDQYWKKRSLYFICTHQLLTVDLSRKEESAHRGTRSSPISIVVTDRIRTRGPSTQCEAFPN